MNLKIAERGLDTRRGGGEDFSILSDKHFKAYLNSADMGIKNVRSRTSRLFTSSLRSVQCSTKNYVQLSPVIICVAKLHSNE